MKQVLQHNNFGKKQGEEFGKRKRSVVSVS
jgi:hypothetical protein